jgi:glycosyltransferase involved in cell wall biosynthesis
MDASQSRLNLLMISPKTALGAYARPHAMGRELARMGHRVSLLIVADKAGWKISDYDWDGVRTIETPHLTFGRLRYGWSAWNTAARLLYLDRQRQQFDLIHCFETRPANIYPALWLARKQGIPLITDWNDWFGRQGLVEVNRPWWYRLLNLKGIETYYEEAFRAKAAGLTVISSALAERAAGLGVAPERLCLIPGGAFVDLFAPRPQEVCRAQLGYPLDAPTLGFSSSTSHFDLEIVMPAVAIVARRYPTIQLIVTGSPNQSVHQMVRQYGLEERVRFTGYVAYEDLPVCLGCADIFLLPMADLTHNRGRWPNKMCEYMSLGRPTVANPVGDIRGLFEKYQVGLLAAWQAEDFAARILELLDQPELARRVGMNARRVAEEVYDWRILAGRLESFYQKILAFSRQPQSQWQTRRQDVHIKR